MRALRDIQTILTVLCGVFLVLAAFSGKEPLAYASVAFGSYFALKAAWSSLRERSIDVNFLMVFAAAGAASLGHPLEAAILLFLFSLSSTLESFAMAKTKNAIEGLIKLRPDQAIRVGSEGDRTVSVAELQKGDRVRILPFEQIPIDGQITEGATTINQQAMTGESQPVARGPGERVLAGTQNLEGMVVVRVSAAAGDTTLEKMVELVRDAQENKASGERISQWFGQKYTFAVIGAFGVALAVRIASGQPMEAALYGALTLLVAMSPCAVVISTPASTLSALAWAARNGMLVRGGEFIELAGRVSCIALDKTGTLTKGAPALAEICVCTEAKQPVGGGRACVEEEACWGGGPQMSVEAISVLRCAAAAEQYSTHPIAEAIVRKAREIGIEVPEAADVRTHSGLGVSGTIDGIEVRVGQRRFFELDGRRLDPDFAVHVEELQAQGMTVAVLEAGDRMAALGLLDEIRPEAGLFLQEMRSLGFTDVLMLTGDTEQTAAAVAEKLGISDFAAGLLPDDKTAVISKLAEKHGHVMMVGDGVNDAPALARASVGVAMGGLGSDITLNAADVVLMDDSLRRLPAFVRLGRMTNRIIRANLYFATGVLVFLALGSMAFDQWLPQYRNWLLPFAVVGHEGSTVLVILNGLRLLRGPN